MAQGHRPDRVGEQIRDVISEILARGEVHDPGIGFITLTRVQVTSDLQIARVFYTSLGDPKARKETARALDRATPFFRRQVAGRLRLRRAPEFDSVRRIDSEPGPHRADPARPPRGRASRPRDGPS